MPDMILEMKLLSDTTFGRGDGIAGEVDAEVQHDDNGFPFLSGRTLKGLLVQECADILASIPEEKKQRWEKAAAYLFGQPGSTMDKSGHLIVGDARLPNDLRSLVQMEMHSENSEKKLTRQDVLESLTALRWQTAINPETGVPEAHTLRSMRVVLRGMTFRADVFFDDSPVDAREKDDAEKLLTACVAALRRVGTGRTRGRGLVTTRLLDAKGNLWSVDAFFSEVEK